MTTQVYWEEQESGFCGVHCTNNLLQGPYFTEVDFSTIALEMDEAEKKLMMEMGTETRDFLKYMAQDSENVNSGGNFSIQVLEKAMGIMNLKIAPFQVSTTSDPTTQTALVCNLKNHWFALRKINGQWFNLNSLLKDGPSLIGSFYLSAFLQQLQAEKYSIFAVTGQFPEGGQSLTGRGKWFPMSSLTARRPSGINRPLRPSPSPSSAPSSSAPSPSPSAPSSVSSLAARVTSSILGVRPAEDTEDAQLQRALKESRSEASQRRRLPEDADLAMALALSCKEK